MDRNRIVARRRKVFLGMALLAALGFVLSAVSDKR